MAAFSYQHPTFVFDSFLQPDTSNNMSSFPHQATIITPNTGVSIMLPDSSGNECFQGISLLPQIHETINSFHKITYGNGNQDPNSSPTMAEMASGDQLVTKQIVSSAEMKRKNVDAKVGSEQGGQTDRKNKRYAKKQKRAAEEAPSDYVHVRARRGQATDSHSLAERVRRAKISVRMKLLQSLVPGCDMITGKAQILDEIIKYVLTLQTQVEFLAAKLSSGTTPMFNDFEVDINTNPFPQESLDFQLSSELESIATQFTSFPEKTPNSNSLLLHQGQRSKCNDNGNLLWDSDHDHSRTQELSNQICMDLIIGNYKGN